jgi:carbonic anhydrase
MSDICAYFCKNKNNFMKASIILSAIVIATFGCKSSEEPQPTPAAHWDYEHPDWQNEGYVDCGGKVESPINIDTLKTIKAHLPSIVFNYNPFNFEIVDNGHTIQVLNTGNNSVIIDGTQFDFKQFHFHHVGEHAINGVRGDLEMHLVHTDAVTGNLMVLGVVIREGPANPTISQVWANIPAVKNTEVSTNVSINLNNLLPADKKYYTYTGSLTTPPCTDGIEWIILEQPITVSHEQIETFTQYYENDARPLQAVNNRFVLQGI